MPPHAPIADAAHHEPHVVSAGVLLGTWGTLIALTALTVAVARMDLGTLNIAAALGIASLKAALVALFFMHLKYDHRFNRVVLVASIVFAVIFAAFVLFDTTQYQPDIRGFDARPAAAPVPAAPAR